MHSDRLELCGQRPIRIRLNGIAMGKERANKQFDSKLVFDIKAIKPRAINIQYTDNIVIDNQRHHDFGIRR